MRAWSRRALWFVAVGSISTGLSCPPTLDMQGEYWWVVQMGGGGAELYSATLTSTSSTTMHLEMVYCNHGPCDSVGSFDGTTTSSNQVSFMNGSVVEWGFQGLDADLDGKAEQLELLTYQGQPAPVPHPVFDLVDCPTCVSDKDGYFLNTAGAQEKGFYFHEDTATTFSGDLFYFAPGDPFPASTFHVASGTHEFDGDFTATAVNVTNPSDTRALVGKSQDTNGDNVADQLSLWIDGAAVVVLPRVPELAFSPYKCWGGPGSCKPALGTPTCQFAATGGFHEYNALATIPFRHGDGTLTPGTARFGKKPNNGTATLDSGNLPGAFTALGSVDVTTSATGSTSGTVTFLAEGWISDYAPGQLLFSVNDGTDDSNQESCESPAEATNETQKLIETPLTRDASFGSAVAIEGNTAVIGAREDRSNPDGRLGAAFVFTKGATWTQVQTIKPPELLPGNTGSDAFGDSLSLSGDDLAVAAPGADDYRGAVFMFERSGGVFNQIVRLQASDGAAGDYFGKTVDLDGDTLAVGAWRNAAGGGLERGAVYMFERIAGVWTEVAKLKVPGAQTGDNDFGNSVALQGAIVVAGEAGDNDQASRSGAVWVIQKVAGVWSITAKIEVPPTGNFESLGANVSLDNGTIVASSRAGVRTFNFVPGPGWQQSALIPFSVEASPTGAAGVEVVLRGNLLAVGNGQDRDFAYASGAVVLFQQTAGVWSEVGKLLASDPISDAALGGSVAVDLANHQLIAGASGDSTLDYHAGSAYVFPLP